MLGTWANDCSTPPSSTNFYAIYKRASGGHVTRVYYNDPDKVYNTYTIVDAMRVTNDQVAYRQKGSEGTIEIVKSRRRPLPRALVAGCERQGFCEGRQVRQRRHSPWQTKCKKDNQEVTIQEVTAAQNAPLKVPPSISKFWPVI